MRCPRTGIEALVGRRAGLVVTNMKVVAAASLLAVALPVVSGFSRTVLVTTVVSGFGQTVAAQGLADAARKADEQRKTNDRAPIVVRQVNEPPFAEVLLDKGSIDTYINTRVAMAKLWQRNRPLFERIRTGANAIERLRDFAGVLASEPSVIDLLKFYNHTPDTIVLTEITMRRALARMEGGYGELSPVEAGNTEYVGRHLASLQYQIRHYHVQEAGLNAWPEWLPY